MKKLFKKSLSRLFNTFRVRQVKIPFNVCLKSGVKGMVTIFLLSVIGYLSGKNLVIAPFASSCITVFTCPEDNFAQPINVIGGYFVATIVGILLINIMPTQWWILGPMLAITITIMAFFRVTHPPAGGIPFVIFYYHQTNAIDLVFYPVMIGSFIIVLMALFLHNLPFSKREYPRK